MPDFYNEAINGIEIGACVGSCGTAAFTRQRVIVKNIQTHPYWAPYKELAAKANLGSCWSQPISGAQQQLLGTFAIYHHNTTDPEPSDLELIEFVAQLTAIVIERHRMIEKAQLSSRVFNNTLEGIIITNADTEIIDVNPAFCDITGFSYDEAIGRKVSILNSGKQSPQFYDEMWHQINQTGRWHGEVWNRKKEGELYAELLTISTLLDDDGNVINYIGVFTDITHSKQQQEKLSLIAHYDVLTGLPNRALFTDRFHQAIAHSKRKNSLLAVCFLDLDNFKHVNDNYGHDVGDQLLVAVAQRLTESIREDDTVSRQGGDEFTLLLNDLESYNQCEDALERIHQALTQPYLT
ncbi:MAG: diguanylate cyclase [Gammaproteobacteria bacterium]|nr:diguanylate cyclase [Gammaproteobacteria bacterium]